MAAAMMKARAIDQISSLEASEAREKSNPLAVIWMVALGLVLGATLLCSAVLMAWPIVAQYASKLH